MRSNLLLRPVIVTFECHLSHDDYVHTKVVFAMSLAINDFGIYHARHILIREPTNLNSQRMSKLFWTIKPSFSGHLFERESLLVHDVIDMVLLVSMSLFYTTMNATPEMQTKTRLRTPISHGPHVTT